MNKSDEAIKKLNLLRDEVNDKLGHIKIYEEAREEHYKVVDALFRFYQQYEDEIELFETVKELPEVVELRMLKMDNDDDRNFLMKNYVFYGFYKNAPLINYVIKNNKNNDAHYKMMLRSVQKCFCSIFKVRSAVPLFSMIEIEDVIRGGTYFVIDKGLSVYAGLDEFKNNFYICSTLTIYKKVAFFDNTVLVDKNNKTIKNFIKNVNSNVEYAQISFMCYFNKTNKLIIDRKTR